MTAGEVNMWAKAVPAFHGDIPWAVDLRVELNTTTVVQVKEQIFAQKPGIPVEWLGVHYKSPDPLDDDKTLAELGVPLETTLHVSVKKPDEKLEDARKEE